MSDTTQLGVRSTGEKFVQFMRVSLHQLKDAIGEWFRDTPTDTHHVYREDCLNESTVAEDLYPREKIHERIKNHAAENNATLLDARGIDADELDVRWCMFEDGVIHYKVTHERIPTIEYDHMTNTGPNTEVVERRERP